jgi:AcrR family transcriptional regulator
MLLPQVYKCIQMPKSAPAQPVLRSAKRAGGRNAAATRAAILASAVSAFAAHGYDGAGVREIARGAGVTAMLVNRYFGSKEKLFAEAVAATMARPVILAQDNLAAPDRARAFATALEAITRPGAAPLDGFAIMLKSAASPRAAAISRAQIAKHHFQTLERTLTGPNTEERAALLLSVVAGLQLMRQTLRLPALAKVDPATFIALLEPLFRGLLED